MDEVGLQGVDAVSLVAIILKSDIMVEAEERISNFTGQGATGNYAKSSVCMTPYVPFKAKKKCTLEANNADE